MGTLALTERALSVRRPLPIKRLMSNVLSLDMQGLPRTARDVLLYLVSLVDVSDHLAPIYPHRSTIADATGLSLPTVYRHLKALAAKGYIERIEQKHAASGAFADTPLCLASRVFSTGVVAHVPQETDGVRDEKTPPPLSGECEQPGDTTGLPSIKMEGALYVDQKRTSNESDDSGSPHKRLNPQTRGVPEALRWLLDLGLDTGKLLSLMAIAKRSGVWLQDLIEAKRAAITNPKSGIKSLFAYLRSLLLSGTDWAWMRERQNKQTTAVVERSAADMRLAEWAGKLAGTKWRHKDGRELSFLGSGAQFSVFTPGKGYAGGALSLELIEAIERGFLLPTIDD